MKGACIFNKLDRHFLVIQYVGWMAKKTTYTEGIWVIKQRSWMARSAMECPCVVTTAFYSQAQWCLCAAEPSWPSRKPQSLLHTVPHLQKHRRLAHRPPFYFGFFTGNSQYTICQIALRHIYSTLCGLILHLFINMI